MDIFLFIIAILLVFVSIFLFATRKRLADMIDFNATPAAVGAIIVAILFGLLSSTTIIAPRTVGVVVEFGKPVNSLSNGLHWKTPWSSVEKLDGAVQNDVYNGESSVTVRLGNNSQARADASIQWQLQADNAMEVFLDYRTFENIQQNLVDRNFKAAINEVMANYNPLDAVDPASGGAELKELSDQVLETMRERVAGQIDVKTVTIPFINFDEQTQTRIDELQSEIARTRVAEQKQDTSRAEAAANAELESSLSNEVLVSKCLDIIAESGQSPIGCFPGSDVEPITIVGENQNQ